MENVEQEMLHNYAVHVSVQLNLGTGQKVTFRSGTVTEIKLGSNEKQRYKSTAGNVTTLPHQWSRNPVLDVPNEVFCAHARPGEMLHLVLLGWFKYVLEESFSLAGPRSEAVKNIDSLHAKVGQLLSRQNSQDLP